MKAWKATGLNGVLHCIFTGPLKISWQSEQWLSTFDLLMYLHELTSTKEDGMDDHDQSAQTSRSFTDSDYPDNKIDSTPDVRYQRITDTGHYQHIEMMIIALVALFCLNIGTPGEAQEVDNANSAVLHSRVKRHRHSLGQQNYHRKGDLGCTLTTCQTLNLGNWLHKIAASKGKDGTPPRKTTDPKGYGKKRRRRSIFLPAYSTRVAQ
ncbi:uncharacterized protein LOC144611412 [Rhinoraja longicauda]